MNQFRDKLRICGAPNGLNYSLETIQKRHYNGFSNRARRGYKKDLNLVVVKRGGLNSNNICLIRYGTEITNRIFLVVEGHRRILVNVLMPHDTTYASKRLPEAAFSNDFASA